MHTALMAVPMTMQGVVSNEGHHQTGIDTNQDTILEFDHCAGTVTVRPFRFSDAERAQRLCNNDKIWINMRNTFPRPYTLEAAYGWITRSRTKASWHSTNAPDATEGSKQESLIPSSWAIAVNGELVGSVGLVFRGDVQDRCAELGYWLGEPYWGQSLATETVGAFVSWAWRTYPWLLRFEANVFAWNPASRRLLEKLGFETEGILKAAVWKNGQVTDMICLAKVREGTTSVHEPAISS